MTTSPPSRSVSPSHQAFVGSPVPAGRDRVPARDLCWARAEAGLSLQVTEPGQVGVVLGRCSRADQEVHLDRVQAAGVPVTRRRGGGCAVVVGPGVLVVSCTWTGYRPPYPVDWMEDMSGKVALALGEAGVMGLEVRRGGDLTLGDRKVMGACLYVGADSAVYGASLLVNPDLSLLERFLCHPPREPAYRRGRPHRDFVTSLWAEGFRLPPRQLGQRMAETLWSLLTRPRGGAGGGRAGA